MKRSLAMSREEGGQVSVVPFSKAGLANMCILTLGQAASKHVGVWQCQVRQLQGARWDQVLPGGVMCCQVV